MDATTYQNCALRTMADQAAINDRLYKLGPKVTQFDNGVRGLTDEVGELASIAKNCIEYGKGILDKTHIKEEVGDCFWRLKQICDAVGLTFEECMHSNIEKLKRRYPDKFSDVLAWEESRDRANERAAVESANGLPSEWDKHPYNDAHHLVSNGNGWNEPAEETDCPHRMRIESQDHKKVSCAHCGEVLYENLTDLGDNLPPVVKFWVGDLPGSKRLP